MYSKFTHLFVTFSISVLLSGLVRAQQTYNLTLPWGIWQSSYNDSTQIYHFENVRFGKAPVDDLRFQASVAPTDKSSEIQPSTDVSCYQVVVSGPCSPGGNIPLQPPNSTVPQNEDCLFLDIYVPKQVMEGAPSGVADTAVAVWIYGGAYLFGSKNYLMHDGFNTPFYSGDGIVQASQGKTIFVAGNYRVGAFGWLAGSSMEQDGYPNAGLSDQRLLFDWVFEYISQVGGDKNQISAWGESAGASSIVHHLISRDTSGQVIQPKFNKAALQSPAFQWNWNDTGFQQQTFINFTCLVCKFKTSSTCCPVDKIQPTPLYTVNELQSMDTSLLINANQALFQETSRCNGLFPVGPSVDGTVIRNLAPIEFASGNFAKLESVILSHCGNEAQGFINPPFAGNEAEYQLVLESVFPGSVLKGVRSGISEQYPVANFNNNQTLRLKQTVQDMAFLSNNRIMFDAFQIANIKTYMLTWDFLNFTSIKSTYPDKSVHATDLVGLFYDSSWNVSGFLNYHNITKDISPDIVDLAVDWLDRLIAIPYKTYWTNHAQTGDVNLASTQYSMKVHPWQPASKVNGEVFMHMKIRLGLLFPFYQPYGEASVDQQLPQSMGDFWLEQAQAVAAAQGLPTGSDHTTTDMPAWDEL